MPIFWVAEIFISRDSPALRIHLEGAGDGGETGESSGKKSQSRGFPRGLQSGATAFGVVGVRGGQPRLEAAERGGCLHLPGWREVTQATC